jgi:tetratricopeptide (TPR) repeat protein
MPLSTSDIAALSRLVDEGGAVPAADRPLWLAQLAPEHAHLRDALREILEADPARQDGFLVHGPRLAWVDAEESSVQAGDRLGPYRLIRELGSGGMGKVWLADRAVGGVRREVALKLPRLAWDDGLAGRMARERDIGGLLEHPNIARLYDAGIDDRGRPYLAFEYVAGLALDAWSQAHALAIRERLQLFLQVARAVAYAHGRLVVHRDLKPSNVLVSDDGVAHLLDFGISKLLDEDAGGDSALTQERGRMLTPHYAAPEQLEGGVVTVASDVYSLGVLLYELLSGGRPFAGSSRSAAALEAAVLRGDPPAASSRVGDKAVARKLRGELDAILAKALRRDPAQRYPTVDAFAQDVERHLAGELVQARPDSVAYRWSKLVRRHWLGLSATAAVVLAIMAGGAMALVQAQRATRQAERARAATEFVSELFRLNAEGQDSSPGATFADRAATLIQTRFVNDPDMQADLLGAVSRVYGDMGADSLAGDYAQHQLDVLAKLPESRLRQIESLLQVSSARLHDEDDDAAEAAARRALELAESSPTLRLDALGWLARAQVQAGRRDAARDTLRLAGSLEDLTVTPGSTGTANLHAALLRLKVVEGRIGMMSPEADHVLELALQTEGPGSRIAEDLLLSRAHSLLGREQLEQARATFTRAMSIAHQRGGAARAGVAVETARFWSDAVPDDVPFEVAFQAIRGSQDTLRSMGASVPPVVRARVDYEMATVYSDWADVRRAQEWLEPSARILLAANPGLVARSNISRYRGKLAAYLGHDEEAVAQFAETLRLRERYYGRDDFRMTYYHVLLAMELADQGQVARATQVLEDDPARPRGVNVRYRESTLPFPMARLALASGDPARAGALLPSYETLIASKQRFAAVLYAKVACGTGHPADGVRLFQGALRMLEQGGTYRNDPGQAQMRAEAGLCALLAGDRNLARQLARRARQTFDEEPLIGPRFQAPLVELERKLGLSRPANVVAK